MTANHIAHKVDAAAVELRLDRISRLYNSLDPSPFQEKELDAAADDYIVGSAEDLGSRPMRLIIFLPEDELVRSEAAHVATSIRHHFELRRRSEWRQLRTMWWRARTSLAVGVIFLVVCLVARHFLAGSPSPIAHIFSEGLLIVGWVAMWGPLDIFLYGWWPIYARHKLLERLSHLEVELRPLK
ncbi:hypothetical protein [Reyranella sp.]|uniref:hypothetical protein n=1 Tax=Reyranella sp. TaxID=1929291 RepID=UPI0012198420|nr:hypothetical protein [Reyranella sp.]TAJ89630.1 MAG: hypothetical protein EPO50_04515 [Reyranella sp.]